MTTGCGVGGGVGLAVGLGVGGGVGRPVGFAVGRTVGAAVRVGTGVGAFVGAGVGAAVGVAVGLAVGADDGDGVTTTVAAGDGLLDGALLTAASDEPGLGLTNELGELVPTGLGAEPPQAATSRHAAASHARRGMGTAAL